MKSYQYLVPRERLEVEHKQDLYKCCGSIKNIKKAKDDFIVNDYIVYNTYDNGLEQFDKRQSLEDKPLECSFCENPVGKAPLFQLRREEDWEYYDAPWDPSGYYRMGKIIDPYPARYVTLCKECYDSQWRRLMYVKEVLNMNLYKDLYASILDSLMYCYSGKYLRDSGQYLLFIHRNTRILSQNYHFIRNHKFRTKKDKSHAVTKNHAAHNIGVMYYRR